jgi:hypothetical protein
MKPKGRSFEAVSDIQRESQVVLDSIKENDFYGVRFEVSTAVTMMIIIFWEMTPCGSYKNRRVCAYTRAYNFAL